MKNQTTKPTLAQVKRQLKIQTKTVENLDTLTDTYKTKIDELVNENIKLLNELETISEILNGKESIIDNLNSQLEFSINRINNSELEVDDLRLDIKSYKNRIDFYEQILNHVTK